MTFNIHVAEVDGSLVETLEWPESTLKRHISLLTLQYYFADAQNYNQTGI